MFRKHDHPSLGIRGTYPASCFYAVDPWQFDIHHDHVRPDPGHGLNGILTIRSFVDDMNLALFVEQTP
ncbi:MAG: hypothetical protein OXH02_01090 [Gemmatimonadetes bacterium]|nr:hypothetical protein [Gemmatimonadota bacterium]